MSLKVFFIPLKFFLFVLHFMLLLPAFCIMAILCNATAPSSSNNNSGIVNQLHNIFCAVVMISACEGEAGEAIDGASRTNRF